jgi:cysteine desulfurase/selenocysteine lyase
VPSSGIVSTVPGVLAGSPPTAPVAPRGSAPGWPSGAPSVVDLGWTDAPAAAPAGDEANYYFLAGPPTATAAEPVPQLPDDHEVFDVNAVRADFPILRETVNGKPLIWFDNAATTQKPQSVIDRLSYFYAHENSNIHRAAHELAARATDAYEDARDTVRRFIGASKSEEIIFVRGTTEAINLVAYAWGGKHLGPGDEIVITHLEHHANIVPWQLLSQQTGAILKVAPVDDAGNLLLSEFEDLLGPKTKLVAATHVSNALGTVTPAKKIVELGHRYGARVLIDGAQSIPHIPIDVQELGADFFVFSGHKIFGPTGIGVVYGREDVLAETPPWQGGGNMIADVTLERSLYQGPPNKFEAGTGNIADAVGLGEALRYVERVGIERIAAYEHALLDYATPRLAEIPGVRLVGTAEEKASVLSFVLAGHEPLEVGKALNAEGIAVRAGHHCAQPILRRMGLEATVRPSFAFYNTFDEIDVFIDAVRRIAEGGASRS